MQTLDLIVGSQMGSAEYVAEQLMESLESQGYTVNLHEKPELEACQQALWLVVTSTYGAGDYPENLLPFISALKASSDLSQLRFAVVGIGDSSYDTFNHAAINLADLLKEKGATQLLDIEKIDVLHPDLPEDTAIAWLPKFVECAA
ncbi:FMN-binding protein MioC [Pseudoalteromonas piscicida]|uniref:FMN-binding protein MioC n=1 Tax=Pseudoalteromonas TaxID=53246 RepID=UPI001BAD49A7|nr:MULTISPECIES: FMN-binding protein MioC [Pseudoalteromonas]QUI72676.1 FMN-binding protein MioC [Pseudoalteromonas sp. M8]UDM59977.1 FMN-binding protein MioC [Pseudoalteromonas piscicida]